MIIVENLMVTYNNTTIIKNINLSLDQGLYFLLGKNGSGKTTLLKTMAGLIKPSRGRVTVFGKDIHKLSRKEAVKLVGYVWQNPYAGFIEANVRDELEFSYRITNVKLSQEIIDMLVPRYLMDRSPFTLSGGEAKRVSMACILALDQPIWLLDEPFDYLDSDGIETVANVINYGIRKGKIIVVASANTAYIRMFNPNQVLVLSEGEIVFKGPMEFLTEEILTKSGIPSRAMICGFNN